MKLLRTKILLPLSALLLLGTVSYSQGPPQAVNNSHIAFTVPEKDLIPESIAYDPVKKDFFMGSTRKGKIVKRDENGTVTDFITASDNGMWMIIGLKVDSDRRVLWACSTGGENLIGYKRKDDVDGRPSGIFKFDLDTGKLLKKYVLDNEKEVHFFNDMTIAKNGTVYITHMFKEHAIYKIGENDVLEKAFDLSDFPYPNGLTLSEGDNYLFVAHSQGIAKIDLKSKETTGLSAPNEVKIARRESIDGLYFHKGSLIGIQPDITAVQRFRLNPEKDSITKAEVLELNHPMMDNPTTGEIVNGRLYFVANAQFGSFNEDGSLYLLDKLYEPVVLKVKLDD